MALNLKSLKANLARENDGEWQEYKEPAWPEAIKLKVRALTYQPYQADLSDALRKAAAKTDAGGKVEPEEAARITGELLAKHILIDWSNIDEPYSAETAISALCDIEDRKFAAIVTECASRVSRIEATFDEAAAKN